MFDYYSIMLGCSFLLFWRPRLDTIETNHAVAAKEKINEAARRKIQSFFPQPARLLALDKNHKPFTLYFFE